MKKKRKIEMPENLDITTRKRKLEEPRNFDIVGNLLCNYGMTGQNLVHEIFSYMDASSLEGKEFCRSSNQTCVESKFFGISSSFIHTALVSGIF